MATFRFTRDRASQIDFPASAPGLHAAERAGSDIEEPSAEDRAHAQTHATLRQQEIGIEAFARAVKLPGTAENAMIRVWQKDVMHKIDHPATRGGKY